VSHTTSLWHYGSSFLVYTLLTVAVIYGAYWYTRKNAATRFVPPPAPMPEVAPAPEALVLESALPLENPGAEAPHVLYVVRTGSERFLIAAGGAEPKLLSKLEAVPSASASHYHEYQDDDDEAVPVSALHQVDLPWYAQQPAPRPMAVSTPVPLPMRRSTFGERFVKSVQWLITSRMKK
jgi:hypothetical protein